MRETHDAEERCLDSHSSLEAHQHCHRPQKSTLSLSSIALVAIERLWRSEMAAQRDKEHFHSLVWSNGQTALEKGRLSGWAARARVRGLVRGLVRVWRRARWSRSFAGDRSAECIPAMAPPDEEHLSPRWLTCSTRVWLAVSLSSPSSARLSSTQLDSSINSSIV